MRAELQPAYILHSRSYRDTSLLVDVFSAHYGKLTLIAKGARKPKQYQRQLLQPFIPVLISWQGKSQLKTLTSIEAACLPFELQGKFLYSGLYLNELLNYILAPNDPAPAVFQLYAVVLEQLSAQKDLEACLRQFEFSLLSELGYGIDFSVDVVSGKPIESTSTYHFRVEQGFVEVVDGRLQAAEGFDQPTEGSYPIPCYSGELLGAIANAEFDRLDVRRAAKQITRLALKPCLRGNILKSRALFKR